jgi:hypothetical protein
MTVCLLEIGLISVADSGDLNPLRHGGIADNPSVLSYARLAAPIKV